MPGPVQKPGGNEFSPLNKPSQHINPPQTKGKSFQDVVSSRKESPKERVEREKWWGNYFSPKQLKRFKQNLLKFLSTQLKYEMRHVKKAEERLKRTEEGKQ